LLIHHNQPIPRDVLMDVFWPEADPEAARNRLHVALHSIRQKLRAVTDMSIVVFQDGAYHLNPDFHLWVDSDEFDRRIETGHRLESAGQITEATVEYELAIGLYQNDLLADDPYEEWPVLARERLRVTYLDTLDRLSHIYFDRDEYAACVTLCQLVLARDNCREDAHCLLMGCYSRQGQHHLALRQYQACAEALRAELDTSPAPTTTQLYERIRRRERI
jgi:DNA-binding SARP family transcriptional activator